MPKLYLASRNQHKITEIQAILGQGWLIKSAQDLSPTLDWEENGHSFHANALIKAKALRSFTSDPILADDSGLEVAALDGKPGIFSARYAGLAASDEDNLQKLLHELAGIPQIQRQARFVCVLCYLDEQDKAHYFEGICRGSLTESAQGAGGFGYDPIFIPDGSTCSFAELPALIKNQISHRAQALLQLQHFLK